MDTKFKNLMSPLQIGSITVKNRYSLGAMGGRYALFGEKGSYTKNGVDYFVSRARGGFGLIVTGSNVANLTVDPFDPLNGNPNPAYAPGVFKHNALELTERVHDHGGKIFMQISMGPGRMRDGKSCSAIPRFKAPEQLTEELTAEEIETKITDMVKLAKLAKQWNYDGVEVHGMHWGYLLDQFAMAYTNHRTDEYGGDLDGRLTVACKIVQGIKAECGKNFPVSIRLCMKTYMAGYNKPAFADEDEVGRTIKECIEIGKRFESYGYDMLNCNSGVYDAFFYCVSPYYMEKGYNIKLAAQLKKAVNIPVYVAGAMDDPDMCEKAIADGSIDGVTLARAGLADADYPRKVARGDVDDIRPCIKCTNCIHSNLSFGIPQCSVNPNAMVERDYAIAPALIKKKVIVIGGGVAGMEAARTSALAGHSVTLYEREVELGGHLHEAGSHAFKSEIMALCHWYNRQLERLNVEVKLGRNVGASEVKASGADIAILSVGADFFIPPVPGYNHPKSMGCEKVLRHEVALGKDVVIVGGGLTGSELAYELVAFENKNVTLVEGLDNILSAGAEVPMAVKAMLLSLIERNGVTVKTGNMIAAVNDDGAVLREKDGSETIIKADNVIFAIGLKPRKSMAEELSETGIDVYEIGDGKGIGNIRTATATAYEIARDL